MSTEDRPMTSQEAAEYLNVPRHTLIKQAKLGNIVARKVGKSYYFKPSDLLAYFESLPSVGKQEVG